MLKNQLFRILPDIEIINSLLQTFGLTSLQDTKSFTKDSILDNETIQKITDMKDKLSTYYIPCKSKVYLQSITQKRCITILRQFIKIHGYTLISKERYINGKKMNIYRLIEDSKIIPLKKEKDKTNITISFE